MRASRLVSILLLLQTRGRMTASELATELETSLRTIYRDLDELAAAGVPVYADRGPAGGYRLVDGYRTRLTGLNADEAEALFLSGLEGAAAQLGLETVLAAAQLKVLAALPPELRSRAGRIRERFHLVAPGWFSKAEDLPFLATAAEAVWESRRLAMTYRRADTDTERVIEPLGLVLKAGIWYLVARRDGTIRTYRVSRIMAARVTDERFERPEGFDLGSHWDESTAEFERGVEQLDVTVLVDADWVRDLQHAMMAGPYSREAFDHAPPPDESGRVRLTVRFSSIGTAHDDLVRLGSHVEVVAPPELRERLGRTARALAALYADVPITG